MSLFTVAALSKRNSTKLEANYEEKILLAPTHLLANDMDSAKLKAAALLLATNKDTNFDNVEFIVRPF